MTYPWQMPTAGTLRDVLQTLETGGIRIAVATDDRSRVVGVMSDGDARRALLAGTGLDAPLEPLLNRSFRSVEATVSRAEVLDLMKACLLDSIPILDEHGTLLGMHRLYEVIRAEKRPNWAVIMVGGRGSRLGSLTDQLPKPMVKVAGRPILERLVLHLVGFGIERIFLATNYLGHLIEEHFGDGARFGCRIDYLREQRPLGTAGALSLLPERAVDPVLVLNGDLVTQADLGAMIDFHQRGRQAATVAVRPYFHTVPFGCLALDDDRVLAIEEKPRVGRIINAGMYVISPRIIDAVPKDEESTMPSMIEACIARNDDVRAFEIDDDWIDVGQREQLQQARGEKL